MGPREAKKAKRAKYVFPAHEVCQSWPASLLFEMPAIRHQHGSLDLLQQSGQTGVKQSTHAATKFITFFYTGFDLPYCNRGAYFSHHLRANDDQMSLPCGVFVFQYNLFTSSSYPFPSLSSAALSTLSLRLD
jgi:hypothetical protein